MIENKLWVLKRISSLRWFLWAPKTGVKIEIDGLDSFSSLPYWKSVFLFMNENMLWVLTRAVSLYMVILSTQDKC